MKAERKHELEHNELDSLIFRVGHFFRENGAVLGILAAVIVFAILTYTLLLAERPITASAGKWEDYFTALSDQKPAEELDLLVDEEKNSTEPAVLWAKLSLADMRLAKGVQQLFDDRPASEDSLASAEKNYADVEKSAGRSTDLRDRARIGLAKVYESQNKPDDAVRYYEMVLKSSPETAYGKIASRGVARLSEESNREFMVWFDKQKPVKKTTPAGTSPFDINSPLPGMPDFNVPLGTGGTDAPFSPDLKLPGDKKSPGGAKEIPGTAPPSKVPPEKPTPPADQAGEDDAPPMEPTPKEDAEATEPSESPADKSE